MAEQVFQFSYAPALARLFAVLGMGPQFARVTVGPDEVVVRMGWAFTARIPRRCVSQAVTDEGRVGGWGVHGGGGHWLVNGSSQGLVRLRIDPPIRARLMMIVPIRIHELRLSLAEPTAFLAAIAR